MWTWPTMVLISDPKNQNGPMCRPPPMSSLSMLQWYHTDWLTDFVSEMFPSLPKKKKKLSNNESQNLQHMNLTDGMRLRDLNCATLGWQWQRKVYWLITKYRGYIAYQTLHSVISFKIKQIDFQTSALVYIRSNTRYHGTTPSSRSPN